ncbi:MAG: transrane sensor [Bacteroidales bacterium]|nr:transrane sensor [Bacteroidales bacterium]
MRRKNNISKKIPNHPQDLNIDKILGNHHLDYDSIDFEKKEADILQAYQMINKQINKSRNLFYYLKNIIKHTNLTNILKPLYTIVVTAVIILTTIKLLDTAKEPEYSIISVDAGEKITVHVNSYISIWLNSNSTVKIPREISRRAPFYLKGEAFIKITESKKKKEYSIISGGMEFRTSSAEFHINSENQENELVAHISEGKVNCVIPFATKSQELTIFEGEKINFIEKAGFLAKDNIHTYNYMAWKTGILQFTNQPLSEVMDILSNYYDIPFTIKNDSLKGKHFTATFNNPTIDEVLNKIMANYNCNITGNGNKLIIN